ncbi:MAG: caspase family protein [Myxococcota bacterium]
MHRGRTAAALVAALILSACGPKAVRTKGLEPARSTADVLQTALEPRRVALVAGVDAYDDPAFPDLLHAGDDARAMGEVFESRRGGGFDEVVVLADPTRAELLDALKSLKASVRRDDVVVVYFSGHGTRAPDGDTWKRYLLGRDSQPSDLDGTAIDLDVLEGWFSGLAPSRKALVVDACFNGDGKSVVRPEHRADGPVDGSLAPHGPLGSGEALLFATTPGRPSLEDDKLGHGVYTYYLLEAMGWGFAEADRDGDQVVTAWEAHDHARAKTLEHTDGRQVPEAALRVVGMADVVLAGEPEKRRQRDRALVYLYAGGQHALSGAELVVDGRTRGVLPGTVPLEPGRHHLALTAPGGVVLAEGYATLSDGHAYRADDLARLVDGPRFGVTVRPAFVASPPFQRALGVGSAGLEMGFWRRDDDPPGRNQVVAVTLGLASSPTRPDLPTARGFGWLTIEGGWQSDWRRLRARATWTLTGVLIPPSYPEGRPAGVPPELLPSQAGWVFGTTGPGLQLGWVLSEVWSGHVMARPTVTALDPDGAGVRAVPWVTAGAGFEAVF